MNDFFNNEYVHIGISLLCIAWGVWNVNKKKNMGSQQKRRTTFEFMDNIYSYLLIIAGILIIIWSFVNIIGAGQ